MLSRPLEEIGFSLKAEVDAQFNLTFKHLEEMKKMEMFGPLFEKSLKQHIEDSPLRQVVEEPESCDFKIPEITDKMKDNKRVMS
jgi:hypothetical protein